MLCDWSWLWRTLAPYSISVGSRLLLGTCSGSACLLAFVGRVVRFLLYSIIQGFVCGFDFLHPIFDGCRMVWMSVRVQFLGELEVCVVDLRRAGGWLHPEVPVVISKRLTRHVCSLRGSPACHGAMTGVN